MYLWILIAIAVIWIVFPFGKNNNNLPFGKQKDSTLDTLNTRLANGEITEEAYKKLRRLIEGEG